MKTWPFSKISEAKVSHTAVDSLVLHPDVVEMIINHNKVQMKATTTNLFMISRKKFLQNHF